MMHLLRVWAIGLTIAIVAASVLGSAVGDILRNAAEAMLQ